MSLDRSKAKADVMRAAWKQAFGREPFRREIYSAMAVAEHETRQGDSWPGTNNYGAVQWRVPTADERAQIAAGTEKKGTIIPGGILEGDSSPGTGGYWCWFRTFPTAQDGAVFFLHMMVSADNAAAVQAGDALGIATGMYLHGYFEDTHVPGRPRGKANGATHRPNTLAELAVNPFTPGEAANVADYAHSVASIYGPLSAQLEAAGWGAELAERPDVVDDDRIIGPADVAPVVAAIDHTVGVIDLPSEHLDEPGGVA
jgi:hypothetical protein